MFNVCWVQCLVPTTWCKEDEKTKRLDRHKATYTLGLAYNEYIDTKETACSLYITVNDFDAKKFAHYSRMLNVTELVVSGTRYA